MFSVYKHTSPVGKVYIGITSKAPRERWQNGRGYWNNKHFYRAIKKYGWNNFEHEILYEGLTEGQANIIEQMQIASYDSANPRKGYNISLGGGAMTGRKHTEEARRKMSETAKGRKVWCEGKKLSEEHRRHLSESHKGIKQSEETKRKRAEKMRGHRVNKGAIEKPVLQYTLSGEFISEYKSMTEAAYAIGKKQFAVAHISAVCKGKRKQSFGYLWKYKKEEEHGKTN